MGNLYDSKTRDSAIEARGVSQTTATSPIDIDSQSIQDVYDNTDVSHHEASKEQPLRQSATGTASELSSDDSAVSVWWRNELDRLDRLIMGRILRAHTNRHLHIFAHMWKNT